MWVAEIMNFVMNLIFLIDDSCLFMMTGIWGALPGLRTEESWIRRVVVQYPSIVAFLFVDVIILIAVTTLTTAQATQVIDGTLTT